MRTAYAKLHQARARIEQRTGKGQWGTVAGDEDIRIIPPSDLEPLNLSIDELDRRHRKGIADFTQSLPPEIHEEVRFLLIRLDFSSFYSKQASGEDIDEMDLGSPSRG